MFGLVRNRRSLWPVVLVAAALGMGPTAISAQNGTDAAGQPPAGAFTVDGRIALGSLISLSDGHLQKLADSLQMLAAMPEVRSGDWEQIQGPLGALAESNIPVLLWFAQPDGSYWSVQEGTAAATLSDRAYFPRLLAGKKVMGDLVVSKATGKCSAIVAVPVFRADGSVAGVLGSSVYLDQLSALLRQEMDLVGNVIFFSFDAQPLVALNWDPALIFLEPLTLGGEIKSAFLEMLSKEQGVVSYTFRDKQRTLLYRKSPVTGWWYAFGVVQDG
jgi:hypothetical protein